MDIENNNENDYFKIVKNNQELTANYITDFIFNNNRYTIYSIDGKDNNSNIFCDKNVDGVLEKITVQEEKEATDAIVRKIFNNVDLNDNIVVDVNGKKENLIFMGGITINDEDYILFSIDKDNISNIYAFKITEDAETFVSSVVEGSEEYDALVDFIENIYK